MNTIFLRSRFVIIKNTILITILFFSINAFAYTTPEECSRQAAQTYSSTNGSENEKAAAGSRTAAECFKEFSASKSNGSEKSFPVLAVLILIALAALAIYGIYAFLEERFRYASKIEMQDLLNRDLLPPNEKLPITDEVLALQKKCKDYLHSKLDNAIKGKSNYRHRDIKKLEEYQEREYKKMEWLRLEAWSIARKKKQSIIENPAEIICPLCAGKVEAGSKECKHCLASLVV